MSDQTRPRNSAVRTLYGPPVAEACHAAVIHGFVTTTFQFCSQYPNNKRMIRKHYVTARVAGYQRNAMSH